jgi:hypothetical protein
MATLSLLLLICGRIEAGSVKHTTKRTEHGIGSRKGECLSNIFTELICFRESSWLDLYLQSLKVFLDWYGCAGVLGLEGLLHIPSLEELSSIAVTWLPASSAKEVTQQLSKQDKLLTLILLNSIRHLNIACGWLKLVTSFGAWSTHSSKRLYLVIVLQDLMIHTWNSFSLILYTTAIWVCACCRNFSCGSNQTISW